LSCDRPTCILRLKAISYSSAALFTRLPEPYRIDKQALSPAPHWVLRTADCPAKLAGPSAVRSTRAQHRYAALAALTVLSATLEMIMTFTQTCTITARRDVVWDFLLQAENVANCLPGVETFKQLDQDNYEGTLRVKVGPISLALQGTLHVEARDREQWHGAMRADAKDRRLGGGVRAHLSMDLSEKGPVETEMCVTLE